MKSDDYLADTMEYDILPALKSDEMVTWKCNCCDAKIGYFDYTDTDVSIDCIKEKCIGIMTQVKEDPYE